MCFSEALEFGKFEKLPGFQKGVHEKNSIHVLVLSPVLLQSHVAQTK
jgi:hypothetical protein